MGYKTEFDLNKELENWRGILLDSSVIHEEDVLELEQHLLDEMDDLMEQGLSNDEAYWVAQKRLGQPNLLATEYQKVKDDSIHNWSKLFVKGGICFFIIFCLINILSTGLVTLGQYLGVYSVAIVIGIIVELVLLRKYLAKKMTISKLKRFVEGKSIAFLSVLAFVGACLYRGETFLIVEQKGVYKSIDLIATSHAVNIMSLVGIAGLGIWFWYQMRKGKRRAEYV